MKEVWFSYVIAIVMTNKISRKIAIFFLIFMLGSGLVPMASYAHNNNDKHEGRQERGRDDNRDDDDDEDRSERSERKEERNKNKLCRKAFKHLFRSGNLGNTSADFYIECLRPLGFKAKFVGGASSTPDTTAPVISNLSIAPATTTATVSWLTDEKSDSAVFWSTATNVDINSSSTARVTNGEKVKNHSMVIGNLTASTTYFLVVRSRDKASNTSTSTEVSFKTTGPGPVTDNTPPVVTNVVTTAGTSTIQVNWNTNEPATSKIYYSTSSDLDVNATSTSFIESLTLTLNHLLSLLGLLPQTIYYLIVQAVDGSGNATTTPVFTATTTNI